MRPTRKTNISEPAFTASHPPRYHVAKKQGRADAEGIRGQAGGAYGAHYHPNGAHTLKPSRTVMRKVAEKREPETVTEKLRDRLSGWWLGISINGEDIVKGAVIALLIVLLTILQTTLFARFRPFGVVPDIVLPFVIAVASLEREKWGAVTALVAAYVIDAAGGTEITILPLLYVPAAFAVGVLTTHRFRDSFSVAALYTVVTSVLRGVITYIIASFTINGISPSQLLSAIVLPEIAANVTLAVFPQMLTRLCLKPFHKTRAERTGSV